MHVKVDCAVLLSSDGHEKISGRPHLQRVLRWPPEQMLNLQARSLAVVVPLWVLRQVAGDAGPRGCLCYRWAPSAQQPGVQVIQTWLAQPCRGMRPIPSQDRDGQQSRLMQRKELHAGIRGCQMWGRRASARMAHAPAHSSRLPQGPRQQQGRE